MASRTVNKVILIGNLGRDAEAKFTPSGVSVTKFAVATSRSWKDQQTNEWKEETNWTKVVLWRQENLAQYLTKGTKVYVEGRLLSRSYEDKEGKKVYTTEVVAEEVILLGGRGEGGGEGGGASASGGYRQGGAARPKPASAPAGAAEEDPFGGMGITDDDVPF
jgi:single-strand DNA-binding protein